jgi:glycosyltransferase involved in cell wall biosynthesis
VLAEAAGAQIVMVCDDDTLLPAVDARVRSSPILASRAIVAGRVSDAEMPNYYGAADLLVSGSHDDGGSAVLIESLAAGVVPIVSELPAYHAIAGDCGWRWRAGDARQLAEAIHQALASDLATQRQRARARFDHHLSWDAIGRRTVDAYRSLMS